MKLNFENIVEQTIAGLITAAIAGIVSQIFTGEFGFPILFFGFLLGLIFATFFIMSGRKTPLSELFPKPSSSNIGMSKESISGREVAQMTEKLFSDDVVKTVQLVLPHMQSNIAYEDAIRIIEHASFSSDKVAVIQMLSSKIKRPLTNSQIDKILSGLFSEDRQKASYALAKNR